MSSTFSKGNHGFILCTVSVSSPLALWLLEHCFRLNFHFEFLDALSSYSREESRNYSTTSNVIRTSPTIELERLFITKGFPVYCVLELTVSRARQNAMITVKLQSLDDPFRLVRRAWCTIVRCPRNSAAINGVNQVQYVDAGPILW